MSVMDFLKGLGGNKEGYQPPEPEGETGDPHRSMVNEIRRLVSQGCRFENMVHPPTVLAALGALAGFGCQTAVREGLIKSGQLAEAKAFEVARTPDGDNYYYGEELNKMLMLNPNSVYAIICGGLMKAGCMDFPNVEASFKRVLESFGGPGFGRFDLPPEYQPKAGPLDCLRRFWPELLPTVAPYWQGPGQPKLNPISIGGLFAAAAHLAIIDHQERIPPAVAGQLVFEAALSMSGIDPASLPEAPHVAAGAAPPMAASQAPAAQPGSGPAAAPSKPTGPPARPGAPAAGASGGPPSQQLQAELAHLVMNTVVQGCVFDGAPHAPTALAALGALAGFGCQMGLRDELIKSGQKPENEVLMASQAPDGSRYYFGPLLNQPLLMLPTSVYSIICDGLREAGATALPDPETTLQRVLASLGTPSFGLPPDLPPACQLKARPIDCLRHFWPQLYPRISQYYGDPAQGGIAPISLGWFFATAARWVIISAKDVCPPEVSGQLVFEAAMSLARLDPAVIGAS